MDSKEKYLKVLSFFKEKIEGRETLIVSKEDLETLFDELKESEDEKTRKDVLAFIRSEGQHIDKYKWHKWIAWLEKQGEPTKINPSYLDIRKANERGVDLDQHRYEIAKEMLPYVAETTRSILASGHGLGDEAKGKTVPEVCASSAVVFADALIAELRKEKKAEWSEEDKLFLSICKDALWKFQSSDKWDARIIGNWLEEKLKQ